MNDKSWCHTAVSMGNKFFVIGGIRISSFEVFQSCFINFTIATSNIKVLTSNRIFFKAF